MRIVSFGRVGGVAVVLLTASGALPSPAVADERSRADRLRGMGEAWAEAGNPASAAAYFRDAIRAEPHNPESYVALGTLYLREGAPDDALDVFRAGLRFRPGHPTLTRLLARALDARGDAAAALRVLDRWVGDNPSDLEAHRMRADLARRHGAWSRALASTRAIVSLAMEGARVEEGELEEARRYAPALALLVGSLDPVRAIECGDEPSPVRRALADCPP